jgi:tetratricopeptide (TPR) repeat protein
MAVPADGKAVDPEPPRDAAGGLVDDDWVSINKLAARARGQGDYASARTLYERVLLWAREAGDKQAVAATLGNLGSVAYMEADYTAARSQYEQSLALSREIEDRRGIALSVLRLGILAYMQGDYASARSTYEECLAIMIEVGDRWGTAVSLTNLANAACMEGDYATARSMHSESLRLMTVLANKRGIALGLAGTGEVAIATGHPHRGARLLGASEALFEAFGGVIEPDDRLPYDRAVSSAVSQLGRAAFQQVKGEGRAMSVEEAIEYALEAW